MNRFISSFICTSLLVGGCAEQTQVFDVGPDLVPERKPPAQGAQGFCDRDSQSNLHVRVRNQGNQPALVQTSTRVVFSGSQAETATTPPLIDGSMAVVSVPIPAGCFNPDCDFVITVDDTGLVEELKHDASDTSHEENNTEPGICIG